MEQVISPTKVDIIIPVYNRLEHTVQTIDSLIKNTPKELFNLYVVDDLSTEDGIKEYLRVASEEFKFKLFTNETNIGPGASRNMVAKWITDNKLNCKYLYHSDNDVYFTEGWLSKSISTLEEHPSVKVLGASCHPYLQSSYHLPSSFGKIGIKDAVSGYSQMMSWETWNKYGPFDESMRGADRKIMGSEDWAFCQNIIKDGFLVGSIEPELVVPCGKTNTYGDPATGSETFKEVEGVIVK